MNTQGGFGGIGIVDGVVEEPEEPQRIVPRHPEPNDLRDMLKRQGETLEMILNDTRAYGERLAALEAMVAQRGGQQDQLEVAVAQFTGWANQHEARVNALAQQVVRNSRFAALSLATQSRGPGEQATRVVQNAAEYHKFMEQDGEAPETDKVH